MEKKIYVIHTSFVSLEHLKGLFAELVPEARVFHIVDDSLLAEVMANGGVTEGVTRRYCMYALQAEAQGADLIFSQCSSVGFCADTAARMVRVPILKVDQAMANQAADIGGRIAVVATLKTTLNPSMRLIAEAVEKRGKQAEIVPVLVEGAFELLSQPDGRKLHDARVIQAIREAAPTSDVITLAQGSMALLLPQVGEVGVPVLASPRMGTAYVREVLGLDSAKH